MNPPRDSSVDAVPDRTIGDAGDAQPINDLAMNDGVVAPDAPVMDGADDAGDVPPTDAPPTDAPPTDAPPADVTGDVSAPPDATAPATARPVAPLTGAHSRRNRPRLRWQLSTGVDAARVTLCRDRAMTAMCVSFDVTGSVGEPSSDLMPGNWYWSVRGLAAGVPVGGPSAVWKVRVANSMTFGMARTWGFDPDVNGDGLADVMAAVSDDAALIYLGGPTGLSTAARSLPAPLDATGFGAAVDFAGDVDGDGYGDVVVSSPMSNALYVFRGGAAGPSTTPTRIAGPAGSGIGVWLSGAGDVNGDGLHDLLAVGTDGAVYFIAGSSDLSATPVRTSLTGGIASRSVIGVGDFNNDGFDDFLFRRGGSMDSFLVPGAAGGPSSATPTVFISGSEAGPAGDLNNDGAADIAIATENGFSVRTGGMFNDSYQVAANGRPNFGAQARPMDLNGDGFDDLVYRTADGLLVAHGSAMRVAVAARVFPVFGAPPSGGPVGAGDVDGDGFDDLLSAGGGVIAVTPGGASGLQFAPQLYTELNTMPTVYLQEAAVVGDVNRDGRADLFIYRSGGSARTYEIHLGTTTGFSPGVWSLLTPPTGIASTAVVGIGDVNGDRHEDVVFFGSRGAFGGFGALTFHGGAMGMTRATEIAFPTGITAFGGLVVASGDINNDGFSDLFGPQSSPPHWLGSAMGLPMAPRSAPDAGFPIEVAYVGCAGDLDGDGFRDVVVQMPDSMTSRVHAGGAAGIASSAVILPNHTVRPLGDINHDGFADLSFGTAAGVEIHLGARDGVSMTAAATLPGTTAEALGDLNNDTFADVAIVTASQRRIYLGGASGLTATPLLLASAPAGLPLVRGRDPIGHGDVDGDGASDLVFLASQGVVLQRFNAPPPALTTLRPPRGAFAAIYR